jgi:hypothetical protein
MERSVNYKWVVILFFGIVGAMFMASVFYLTMGRIPTDTFFGRRMELPNWDQTVVDRSPSKFILELNKGKKIGNRVFFFKGIEEGYFLLDVIIPELDTQYSYPMKISVKKAKKGFVVADDTLKLTSLGSSFAIVVVVD